MHYQYSYSPWGVRTYLTGDTIHFCQPGEEPLIAPFYRTYTGHEDLWMFGLLNANARLYSPYLGRFISPDPLLNEDGGPLDYNPYIYARNNPYRYIDRNGEFWWLAPIIIGAAMNAATYSITAAITGDWNVGDFFKSMGMGAVTGTLSVGTSMLGTSLLGTSLGSFGNNFTYGLLSNMVNNTITNTIFGEGLSFGDIPSMIVGAAFSAVLPTYSPVGANLFKNVVSEIGFNTLRGAITGSASGSINALVHNDPSLIWKGAVGGAISGFSRTVLVNAIFGAAYQPLDENNEPISYGVEGVYRKGGITGFVMNTLNRGGDGVTLGRHVFSVEKGESIESIHDTRAHENKHLQQIEFYGVARFYGSICRQYVISGFGRGALEKEAYRYGHEWVKKWFETGRNR
ncbi:MAG: RHS repeat-associated core domain-containing protein [Bacteroidaceae bacterium]|nr:RHS repeat-associated core domain-containing protein [Bacteroidaceae bacterium]